MIQSGLSDPSSDPVLKNPYRAYTRKHWRPFALGLFSLLGTNSLDAIAPLLIGMAIDQIIGQKPFADVARMVFIIFAVTAALALFRFMWRYFWGQFHHTVAEDLRNRLFAKFTDLGPAYFARQTTGGLMSLINNDVNSFRMAIGPGMLVLFDSIFLLLIVPVLMWRISPDWTWRCMILMPFVPFVVRAILNRTEKAYTSQQARFSEMAGAAQEIVAGIRVIKSYAQENNQTRLFNTHSRRYMDACNQVAKVDASFGPALEIAAAFGSVILLLIASGPVMAGAVTLGQLFAFYQYIQKMVWPLEGIGIAFSHFQVGRAAFTRIREMLLQPVDTPDVGQAEPRDVNLLEVKNLTFTYPGESRPALRDVSFSLKKGQVLGVVGATGAGKTTLAEVLCHLYPVPSEKIFINQLPLEHIRKKSLRHLITMVPQETFVFSRELGANILFGCPQDQARSVKEAAALVKLDQEIESWPEGYDTLIGERGVNLSGGQRQRVTLARALIRTAPLVIIDDALSAVDAKTGAMILQNLRHRLREGAQCAAMIISHRLANVSWADQILVLNQGKVEAFGRHDELLQTSPTYRHLNDLQTAGDQA
ncbi:MAG: ABC transporter ATP-binding protein [Bdellovibrionales bacterium]